MSNFKITTGITPPREADYGYRYTDIFKAFDLLDINEWMQIEDITWADGERIRASLFAWCKSYREDVKPRTSIKAGANNNRFHCALYIQKVTTANRGRSRMPSLNGKQVSS